MYIFDEFAHMRSHPCNFLSQCAVHVHFSSISWAFQLAITAITDVSLANAHEASRFRRLPDKIQSVLAFRPTFSVCGAVLASVRLNSSCFSCFRATHDFVHSRAVTCRFPKHARHARAET